MCSQLWLKCAPQTQQVRCKQINKGELFFTWYSLTGLDSVASTTHLPCGLHAFPNAEEADDPNTKETQSQVPFDGAHLLDAVRDAEDVAPEG